MRETKVGGKIQLPCTKIMNGNHKEVGFSSSKDGMTCKRFPDRLEVRINSYYNRPSPTGDKGSRDSLVMALECKLLRSSSSCS